MPDKEYRIRILTVGDPQGAKEVKSSLDDVTKSTQKSTEANEEHHKSFIHAGNGAHELHKVLHQLAEESPLMGLALKTAISPIGGAFLAAVYAMQLFKKAEEESMAAAKANAEAAAQAIGDMKQSAQEAATEIAGHNREFEDWLKNLGSGTSAVKDNLSGELQLMQAQAEAQDDLLDKEKQLALAKNDERVATGEITKDQGIVNAGEIERQFAHAVSGAKLGLLQGQFSAKRKALLDTSGQMVSVGGFIDELQEKSSDPTRATLLRDLPKRIAQLEKDLPAREAASKEALTKLDKAQQDFDVAKKFGTAENVNTAGERLFGAGEESAKASHAVDSTMASLERNKKALSELTAEQDKWHSSLELAKKDYGDMENQFQALSREVESLRITLSVKGPASGQALSLGDAVVGSKAFSKLADTDWGKMIFGGEGGGVSGAAARVLAGGAGNTPSELEKLDAMLKFLGANATNAKKFLEMLAGASSSIKELQSAIATLQAQYEFLRDRQPTRLMPGSG